MNDLRTLKRRFKRWAGTVLGRALGGWFAGVRRGPPANVQKILVVRIDERVGNVLLTTPLIKALTERFPQAQIDVLVAASKARIIQGLARLVPYEKKDAFRRPSAYFKALWSLRRRRYDVVIDASHWHHFSLSSAVLLAWTAAPLRIAHERGNAALFATDTVPAPPSEPEIKTKLRLLGPLGFDVRTASMETPLGTAPKAVEMVEAWKKQEGLLNLPVVSLAPGSRKHDHRASEAVFSALGKSALEAGAKVVVLWGPGEELLAQRVRAKVGNAAKIAPPTDLDQLAAFMRSSAAVIANDTGPMHLSVACGAPTIALFKGADPVRWGHPGAPNAVVVAEGRPEAEIVQEAQNALHSLLEKTG